MEYRLGKEPIIIKKRHLKKVGIGNTGNVYNYQGKALKIFNSKEGIPISEKDAAYLSKIKTNHILLPEKLLYYEDSFKGYTYKLVSKKGTSKKIVELPKKELINTTKLLEKDATILSKKNVLLNGIEPNNIIFNGELFLCDPSKYTILDLDETTELELLNKYQIHLLLTELLSKDLKEDSKLRRKINYLKELMKLIEDNQNTSDFFNDILEENESIKQLIKKI